MVLRRRVLLCVLCRKLLVLLLLRFLSASTCSPLRTEQKFEKLDFVGADFGLFEGLFKNYTIDLLFIQILILAAATLLS